MPRRTVEKTPIAGDEKGVRHHPDERAEGIRSAGVEKRPGSPEGLRSVYRQVAQEHLRRRAGAAVRDRRAPLHVPVDAGFPQPDPRLRLRHVLPQGARRQGGEEAGRLRDPAGTAHRGVQVGGQLQAVRGQPAAPGEQVGPEGAAGAVRERAGGHHHVPRLRAAPLEPRLRLRGVRDPPAGRHGQEAVRALQSGGVGTCPLR